MKTKIRMFRIIGTMLLVVTVLAGFTACETDPVEQEGGKLPDKEAIETVHGILRITASTEKETRVLLTQNSAGYVMRSFYFQQTQPADGELILKARADETLLDAYNAETGVERALLPAANYEFPDGNQLSLAPDMQRSAAVRIKFIADGLQPGEYLLPLTVASEDAPDENQTVYYTISVREPYVDEYALHDGSDIFFVFYINTKEYQPLLVQDYLMQKSKSNSSEIWYGSVGNIINLRTVTVKYDEFSGRAILDLGSDMTYVLGHASKYIWPLQEQGRKVCISLEGGGTGLGFCNLSDEQIADFVAQVKAVVETYNLDGINLWDRNAGYGKEGMPETNTTSYPKLIQAMRTALGSDKLLTLTVYEEPTATFWDAEATGGIKVGEYLDYAWSGYNSNTEAVQLLDPWHPNESYVSDYTQKPIAGLDASKFGCVNFPIYPSPITWDEALMQDAYFLVDWILGGYMPNNILVFSDLRTNLQDNYEGSWDVTFATCCTYFDKENYFVIGFEEGCMYSFDINRRLTSYETEGGGISGYGKWLKDW